MHRLLPLVVSWADDTKDAVKRSAAEEAGVTNVDLAEIRDDPNYEVGMGTMVEGDDGKEHEIEHPGVAKHPEDTGMKWIAKKMALSLFLWYEPLLTYAQSPSPLVTYKPSGLL